MQIDYEKTMNILEHLVEQEHECWENAKQQLNKTKNPFKRRMLKKIMKDFATWGAAISMSMEAIEEEFGEKGEL